MNRKVKPNILAIIMLIGVIALTSACSKSTLADETKEEDRYVPVEVENVTSGTIENEFKVNGKIVANEEVAIMPKVMGIVTNINVELGSVVKKGDLLFTIEEEDISKTVRQAESSRKVAVNGVEQAKNALRTAELNYEANKEQVENAQRNLERIEELYEDGSVSKSDLEQARLAASEKGLETLKTQITQAEIAYEQALNQLTQVEISHEQALSNLGNTRVTAPMDGIISTLNVKKGQMATNSQAAAVIVDIDTVYVQVDVVENMVNKLAIGQEVQVKIPSIILEEDIVSTIYYISPTADERTNLYPVKIYVDNSSKKIRPGMNSEVLLGTGKVSDTIVIKSYSVLDRDGEEIVYLVEEDKAVERVVETGIDNGEYIEIKKGLAVGEQVIVEGQHYVEDGTKVKVVGSE